MKNPFSPDAGPEINVPRIPRDLSNMNLFTTEFGRITPVDVVEVLPNDTHEFKSVKLSIQGMPTNFPIQTPLHVSVSYYYARNRCVHDQFEDFIFKTKDVESPWLRLNNDRAKKMISTGSLGDFLGVSTTKGSENSVSIGRVPEVKSELYYAPSSDELYNLVNSYLYLKYIPTSSSGNYILSIVSNVEDYLDFENPWTLTFDLGFSALAGGAVVALYDHLTGRFIKAYKAIVALTEEPSTVHPLVFSPLRDYSYISTSGSVDVCLFRYSVNPSQAAKLVYLELNRKVLSTVDATDDDVINENVYVGNDPVKRLPAYVFRHYEQICNYYYRNDKNNPYVLNGEVQYNEFIPSHDSGPDENVYDFHYRNYELDMFTSAVQSPQFGEAPLVGLTFNGNGDSAVLTFSGEIDGEAKDFNVEVGLIDDKIVGISNFDKEIPSANLRRLTEMISYGISINDFRVTNSYQRFKENMMRRGLRYRNQLRSHFGATVDYPDIDIPQYIGGFSGMMNAVQNQNMTASEYANLGDFNGGLFGNFELPNPIKISCHEHGFIIALMTIVPIPCYPQATAPYLTKNHPFDYFLPEFGKIGYTPLHYDIVCPQQNVGTESPDDVFGYQKAFADYMQRFNVVHGDFKTTLRDFCCMRTFAERPELSEDFTTVHPESLNHIFITGNIADKYQSNAKFMCKLETVLHSIRQVPDIGTPSLE